MRDSKILKSDVKAEKKARNPKYEIQNKSEARNLKQIRSTKFETNPKHEI
ncbi:MAG: hypothetical protein HBSIN02_20200 [Bacteroidia bacterium]|nr:MAG: hypothetical protein HBSIN02_20200 [Bacteroidia bacterium]